MSLWDFDRDLRGRIATLLLARHRPGLALIALMMLSILAMQTQRASLAPAGLEAAAPLKKRAAAAKETVPPPPTQFEIESAMTPAELIRRWDPIIKSASSRFGVPENWIRAVMRQETGGRTMLAEGVKIVSPMGAMGLMQLMPGTYAELRKVHGLGSDPHDPQDNIYAGAAYLGWLKRRYGFNGMFAAYNAGPGVWEKARAGTIALPGETQTYVRNISRMLGRTTGALETAMAGLNPGTLSRKQNHLASASPAQLARYRKILLTIPLSTYQTVSANPSPAAPATIILPAAAPSATPLARPAAAQLASSTAGRMWTIE